MRKEPANKRTVAFVDGQNLFHAVKRTFGYAFPNYDILALAAAICVRERLSLVGTRFYTGVPAQADRPILHHFWTGKTAMMGKQGVHVFTRPLRSGVEKGIDVRLAIDVIRMAHRNEYDVALVFSQDQDLSEAADEIRLISMEQDRWIKVVSAYPFSPSAVPRPRGINSTDWLPIDRGTYDQCLDSRDYRPPRK